jgi:hypothetical protein
MSSIDLPFDTLALNVAPRSIAGAEVVGRGHNMLPIPDRDNEYRTEEGQVYRLRWTEGTVQVDRGSWIVVPQAVIRVSGCTRAGSLPPGFRLAEPLTLAADASLCEMAQALLDAYFSMRIPFRVLAQYVPADGAMLSGVWVTTEDTPEGVMALSVPKRVQAGWVIHDTWVRSTGERGGMLVLDWNKGTVTMDNRTLVSPQLIYGGVLEASVVIRPAFQVTRDVSTARELYDLYQSGKYGYLVSPKFHLKPRRNVPTYSPWLQANPEPRGAEYLFSTTPQERHLWAYEPGVVLTTEREEKARAFFEEQSRLMLLRHFHFEAFPQQMLKSVEAELDLLWHYKTQDQKLLWYHMSTGAHFLSPMVFSALSYRGFLRARP